MITVGAFEAKTQFSALLERVASGEEVLITRHGKPIARLSPSKRLIASVSPRRSARLKEMAAGCRLDGLSVRKLRNEGRA